MAGAHRRSASQTRRRERDHCRRARCPLPRIGPAAPGHLARPISRRRRTRSPTARATPKKCRTETHCPSPARAPLSRPVADCRVREPRDAGDHPNRHEHPRAHLAQQEEPLGNHHSPHASTCDTMAKRPKPSPSPRALGRPPRRHPNCGAHMRRANRNLSQARSRRTVRPARSGPSAVPPPAAPHLSRSCCLHGATKRGTRQQAINMHRGATPAPCSVLWRNGMASAVIPTSHR